MKNGRKKLHVRKSNKRTGEYNTMEMVTDDKGQRLFVAVTQPCIHGSALRKIFNW